MYYDCEKSSLTSRAPITGILKKDGADMVWVIRGNSMTSDKAKQPDHDCWSKGMSMELVAKTADRGKPMCGQSVYN